MDYAYTLLAPSARRSDVLSKYAKGYPMTPRRMLRCAQLVSTIALVFFLLGWIRNYRRSGRWDPPPIQWEGGHLTSPSEPSYAWLKEWEHSLPQHNLSLPFPEGRYGRYVKFGNQIQGLGWNNVQTDLLLSAHLAYESKRAYVFQDYEWAIDHYPWPLRVTPWTGPSTPRTPLNAILSGPAAGGAFEDGDDTPRAISAEWWDVVCANPDDVEILWTDDVKKDVRQAEGDVVLQHWAKRIRDSPKRCVHVLPSPSDGLPQVFDLWLVGSSRIVSIWDSYKAGPVSRLLGASPIIRSAVVRNEHLFVARGEMARRGPVDPYQRMLAAHVRRGDYAGSCAHFARWSSSFYGWNQLPFLPDRFEIPGGASWGENTPENTALYMRRCWPTTEQIVRRMHEARAAYVDAGYGDGRVLDIAFVLSDGDRSFIGELREALMADGWGTVVTSRDLQLDSEQYGVAMAVDMEVAAKAAVFVGNGWSSFTSNIMHRRLVSGKEGLANRHW